MAEILLGGKRLGDLKVAELKSELDKRSLSKKGVKIVLINRLKTAILKEELTQSECLTEEEEEYEEFSQPDTSQTEDEAGSVKSKPVLQPDLQSPSTAKPMTSSPEPEGEAPPESSAVPEEGTEPSTAETFDPALNSDQSAVDVEITSPCFDDNVSHDDHVTQDPLELTMPLSPGSELNLSMEESVHDAEFTEERKLEEDIDVVGTVLASDVMELGEEAVNDESSGEQSTVKIDPSYLPDNEELLYEGDVEHDTSARTDTSEAPPTSSEAPPTAEGHGEDGFIVDLHVTSTDLDVGTKKESSSVLLKEEEASSTAPADARPDDCHLWVSGLVATVRALDLQTLFSPFGQVISAKVVAKARSRATNRFGYITMATPDQAERSIKELSGTELKGRTITVAVAKSKPPLAKPVTIKPLMDVRLPKEVVSEPRPEQSGAKTADKRGSSGKAKQSNHSPRERSRRASNRRSRSPAARSPPGSILRGSAQRRSSPGPLLRRGSPPSRPRSAGRLGPHRRRSPSHRVVSHVGQRGDARQDILRRAMARRISGGDPYLSERERQAEMRLQERRLVHDRHQEMQIRRQLEVEHARREQEILRRIQERDIREREARERQLAEQERLYKERERVLREREMRERQRREALERELRERENREREMREREKRLKEQHERELREREVKAQREKEARERELRAQVERERELRDRERHLREERERAERERRAQEEQQRQLREQQRAREEARIRDEQEARAREEQERRERERKEQERSKMKREREEMQQSSSRLGKRPYSDGGTSYEPVKRQAVHAVQRSSDSFNSSPATVFGRLDAQNLQKHSEGSAIPSLMSQQQQHADSFRRESESSSSQYGQGSTRHSTGSYGFMGGSASRDRQSESIHYPIQLAGTTSRSSAQNIYAKVLSGGSLSQARVKTEVVPRLNPDVITAATQALENIRKSVQGGVKLNPQLRATPPSVAAQLHQLSASAGFLPHRQTVAFPAGSSDSKKLPPEEERYNRRLGSRASGHHSFNQRQPYKRL